MRSGGSKQKGTNFKRFICKELSLWISHYCRDDLFWRSAMSGGRATIQLKQDIINKTQQGDISAIDPAGFALIDQFIIECKAYSNIEFIQGVLKGTGYLVSFWAKLCLQCSAVDKQPMLIARQNHMPIMCIVTSEGAEILKLRNRDRKCIMFVNASVYLFDTLVSGRVPVSMGVKVQ